jgi:hypothetical protein
MQLRKLLPNLVEANFFCNFARDDNLTIYTANSWLSSYLSGIFLVDGFHEALLRICLPGRTNERPSRSSFTFA